MAFITDEFPNLVFENFEEYYELKRIKKRKENETTEAVFVKREKPDEEKREETTLSEYWPMCKVRTTPPLQSNLLSLCWYNEM